MNDVKFTLEEIEQGYFDDDSEDMICLACGEHASESYEIIDGEIGDSLGSNCCGANAPYYD